jgi:hypothetical protein
MTTETMEHQGRFGRLGALALAIKSRMYFSTSARIDDRSQSQAQENSSRNVGSTYTWNGTPLRTGFFFGAGCFIRRQTSRVFVVASTFYRFVS